MKSSHSRAVAREFLKKFYTTLNKNPEELFRFYKSDSTFSFGYENEEIVENVIGVAPIQQKIHSLNYQRGCAKILFLDVHDSFGSGIVIVVMGILSNELFSNRRFMETFFLAPQLPNGYYVLNDAFRFLVPSNAENLHINSVNSIEKKATHEAIEKEIDSEKELKEELEKKQKEKEIKEKEQREKEKIEKEQKEKAYQREKEEKERLEFLKLQEKEEFEDSDEENANYPSNETSISSDMVQVNHKDKENGNYFQKQDNFDSKNKQGNRSFPPRQKYSYRQYGNKLDAFSVYVGNVPYDVKQEQLEATFSNFGHIKRVNMQSVQKKGFAFIEFDDQNSAREAIKIAHQNPILLGERQLTVEEKLNKQSFYSQQPRNNNRGQRVNRNPQTKQTQQQPQNSTNQNQNQIQNQTPNEQGRSSQL